MCSHNISFYILLAVPNLGGGEDQKSQNEEIGNIGLSGTRLNKKPLARVDRGD